MEEQTRELSDFQKAFRDKELREGAELKSQDLLEDEEDENVDTQHGRYMTFKIEDEYYGIAITYVSEIIGITQITELPETPEYIKGLINLRGKIIPILDVRVRFEKPEVAYDDRTCVIVTNVGDDTVGLIVDTIADVVSIEDEDILDPPSVKNSAANHYISGIGKIGGEVKLIVDPAKLIYEQEQ